MLDLSHFSQSSSPSPPRARSLLPVVCRAARCVSLLAVRVQRPSKANAWSGTHIWLAKSQTAILYAAAEETRLLSSTQLKDHAVPRREA